MVLYNRKRGWVIKKAKEIQISKKNVQHPTGKDKAYFEHAIPTRENTNDPKK